MSITWADVVAIAPNLSVIQSTSATAIAILAAVDRQIDDSVWNEFADDGRRYLAAHLASIRDDEGLVTSETIGAMSRSYAMPPGIMGSLALSTFGAEYLRLLSIAVGVPGIVV